LDAGTQKSDQIQSWEVLYHGVMKEDMSLNDSKKLLLNF